MEMKKKRVVAVVVVIAVVLLVIAGGYSVRHIYTKSYGAIIHPTRDFRLAEVSYYLQNDPEWSGDIIGDSDATLGGTGCLVTCVAAVLETLGVDVTPGELNARLTEVGGYEIDSLIWNKLGAAYPGVDYRYSRIFTVGTIERDLEAGLLPIVNVRYNDGDAPHWVVILGAEDGEYMVYDPLNSEREPIPLSVHGKVYSYRVLVLGE